MAEKCAGSVPMLELKLSKARCAKGGAGLRLASPQAVADFVRATLACDARERLFAIYLDSQNLCLGAQEVSVGGLAETQVDPRVILAPAVITGASSIILAHNHPSGSAEPSAADVQVTRTIKVAAKHLSIRVLDHLIITATTYTSMQTRGLVDQ